MPSITASEHIDAPPEKVFDLVSHVESFSNFSSHIKEIRKTPDGTYLWRVALKGVELEWESRITESMRPSRIAWSGGGGVENSGAYEFIPSDGGTLLVFEMNYRFDSRLLASIVAPVLEQIMRTVSREILQKVKQELEGR